MKILAIGNSFSEDATYYFKKIADSANVDVTVVNLYIGSCSLETHALNIKENNRNYRYELNGVHTKNSVSIVDTLKADDWNIVTVQQVSGKAGVYESYGESFKTVLACIKENCPNAKIYFHETWSYEIGSTHRDFPTFGNNQETMDKAIVKTVKRICKENGDLPIIATGEVVSRVRKTPLFDVKNGGVSLCRDGFHFSLTYGRYLAGLVWFSVLLNGKIEDVSFVPTQNDIINGYAVEGFECDAEKIQSLKATVTEYFK